MERIVLEEVELDTRHRPTGNTRHISGGVLQPPPVRLQIVRYEGDQGLYLLYLDADGQEQNDTWHQTLNDAHHQADFEFGVQPTDWTDVASER